MFIQSAALNQENTVLKNVIIISQHIELEQMYKQIHIQQFFLNSKCSKEIYSCKKKMLKPVRMLSNVPFLFFCCFTRVFSHLDVLVI